MALNTDGDQRSWKAALRSMRVPLWWCPNCNVPLREPRCSKCDGEGVKTHVADPGDIRPAFEGDLALIDKALGVEFGDSGVGELLGLGGVIYLNRVPSVDEMKEVVAGGVVVGRMYFDLKSMEWRWRLTESSAQILVEHGRLDYVVRSRVKPLEVVKHGGQEGSQLPVVNPGGRVVALAISRGGTFRVQKIFRERPAHPLANPKATLGDVLRANEGRLRRMVSTAAAKAYTTAEKLRRPLVASYSGGKDSLVSLHLCLEVGLEPRLLFNDTGLELPETVKNVEEVSRLFDLELDYLSSGDSFWRALETYGPPARDYRWCCKVVKLAPIARYYRERYPGGALVVVGQRAYESLGRSRSGHLWRNKWLPSVLNLSPIQEWDQLTEWLYILKHRLPYNPLYERGFDRLGCYLCPAANVAEFCLIERLYPDLWERWARELERWREATGQPGEWVRYHLWRWLGRGSPGRRRVTSYLGVSSVSEGVPADHATPLRGDRLGLSVERFGESLVLRSERYGLAEPVLSQRSVLGLSPGKAPGGTPLLLKQGGRPATKVVLRERVAVVEGEGAADVAYDLARLVARWYKCVGCGNCSNWCPRGAVAVVGGRPRVDPRRCSSCRVCLEVCPLASVYVDKVERYKLGYPYKPRKRAEVRLVLELYRAASARRVENRDHGMTWGDLETLNAFLKLNESPT